MSVETYVDAALTRAQNENEQLARRLDGFERFGEQVRSLDPVTRPTTGQTLADGGVITRNETADQQSQCSRVRRCFAEEVKPDSTVDVDDSESVLETLSAELNEQIALAVAPTSPAVFSPEIKRGLLSAVTKRTGELSAMKQAVEVEIESLKAAEKSVTAVTEWLRRTNEIPLSNLGFETLASRHERLEQFREECEAVAKRRQETIGSTTSNRAGAAIEHQQLLQFLYKQFDVTHPVLATVLELADLCENGQQTVRDHLVRRV